MWAFDGYIKSCFVDSLDKEVINGLVGCWILIFKRTEIEDMLGLDEGEDLFFDAAENLYEEPVVVKEKGHLSHVSLGYEIWLKEPQSVQERRDSFLRRMGFLESASSNNLGVGKESNMIALERATEFSGAVSSNIVDSEELNVFKSRELNGEGNCALDGLEQDVVNQHAIARQGESICGSSPAQSHVHECKSLGTDKIMRRWWKRLTNKRNRTQSRKDSRIMQPFAENPKANRMKVRQNKKKCMELTALYIGQEIHAHEGSIWTMKFSPDGQYLASGGEDGVIRIWRIMQADAPNNIFYDPGKCDSQGKGDKSTSRRNKSSYPAVFVPDKVFQIEELPVQEFHGHTSDVLDLAWSKSNYLLSSSTDKTVRLWQVDCTECLGVFKHSNYVTCIQFNPVDENYFISGSIDGKVRIWGVSEGRVVDWADAQDVVTAISYHPDGKVFIVGYITGSCHFYAASDGNIQLNAQIHFGGRKKSSNNKITSIQFANDDPQRVLITAEDSKVRILDGIDIVYKYKGLSKSRSQMSASFTSNGRHIVSVGEDSRVYVWNYDKLRIPASKQENSVRSCEHFFLEDVSLAIPWSSVNLKPNCSGNCGGQCCLQGQDGRDLGRGCFSLDNWFPLDGSSRSCATWPEEKLPLSDVPTEMEDPHHHHHHHHHYNHCLLSASTTWGLVIVTAGWDGMIRTVHNYGLPIRTWEDVLSSPVYSRLREPTCDK
ncbi:hypothetical protein NMG60_11007104 [Bertholletia excelsa]